MKLRNWLVLSALLVGEGVCGAQDAAATANQGPGTSETSDQSGADSAHRAAAEAREAAQSSAEAAKLAAQSAAQAASEASQTGVGELTRFLI